MPDSYYLILNNLNIIPFAIIAKLWPVIFIILGVKLLYDMHKRRV